MDEKIAKLLILFVVFLSFKEIEAQNGENLAKFEVSWTRKTVIIGESHKIWMILNSPLSTPVSINLEENNPNLLEWSPKSFRVLQDTPSTNLTIQIEAKKAGSVEITGKSSPSGIIDDLSLFFKVTIARSNTLIITATVVGWIYFVAWSISFYPQIIINFRRKSVVGLSFDFLALNAVGHTLYGVFNVSLYFFGYFQDEYFKRFPFGVLPVELNDVFFSIHATLLTAFTVAQCFIYERGNQRISYIARSILGIFLTTFIIVIIISSIGVLHWLDFLYTCSYIKLAVTLTKYIPQAWLNYRRKSTIGWSIENILLDLTGGVLSMLQMVINSYNYDDWASNFGNPTKFGLGLFSIFFDLIFIVQHYCLYRSARHPEQITTATDVSAEANEKSFKPEKT